ETLIFSKCYMKKVLIFFFSTILLLPAQAQQSDKLIQKIIKKAFSTEKDSTRKASFFILPAFAYAQETGAEFGVAATYDFYLDKQDLNSRTSNITLISTTTSKRQIKINLNAYLLTKNKDCQLLLEFPAPYWLFFLYGLGNETSKADEDYLDVMFYSAKVDV